MSIITIQNLKSLFQNKKVPRESHYIDFIDTLSNLINFEPVSIQPAYTSTTMSWATNPGGITIISFKQAFFVNSPNNSSNYWNINLKSYDGSGTPQDIANSNLLTNGISPGEFVILSRVVGTTISSSIEVIAIRATQVGSPGELFWGSPIIRFFD